MGAELWGRICLLPKMFVCRIRWVSSRLETLLVICVCLWKVYKECKIRLKIAFKILEEASATPGIEPARSRYSLRF